MRRLRRALLASDQPLARGLCPLLSNGWFIALMGSLVTLGIVIGSTWLFTSYSKELYHLGVVGNGQTVIADITYNVHQLSLMAKYVGYPALHPRGPEYPPPASLSDRSQIDDDREETVRERIIELCDIYEAEKEEEYQYAIEMGTVQELLQPSITLKVRIVIVIAAHIRLLAYFTVSAV